jgi:hypothetical protein
MDGTSRVSKWMLRRVAIVTAVGLAGGGLLVLEHVGTGGATGQPSHVPPNARPAATSAHSNTGTSVPNHCTDGRGRDNEKNKHCRTASGV